jgi:hypothetical protein
MLSRCRVAGTALFAVALIGAPARAAVRVRVDPATTLPFTAEELRQAIALRLDGWRAGAALEVSIAALGGDTYRLGVGRRSSRVELADQSGPSAVRTVALVAVDLAESEPAPPRWVMSAQAMGCPPGGWGDGRFEASLDLGLRFRPGWSVLAGAGYEHASRTVYDQRVKLDSLPVRLGVGLDLGWLEARAGGVLRLIWAGGAQGSLFGGWLEARVPVWRGALGKVALLAAAEVTSQRLEVRPAGGTAAFSSGYVTPWLGVGLSTP